MAPSLERLSFRDDTLTSEFLRSTVQLHKDRYAYAADFLKGCRVLDIACGVGYGSAMLKDMGAESVVGIDIDSEAIREADETQARPDVTFASADYRALRSDEALAGLCGGASGSTLDGIVSLETIEHLPDPDDFLDAVLPLLKPGGLFIGSVPVTPSMDANPFHLQDFSPGGFRRLLKSHGLRVETYMRQRQTYNPFTVRKTMTQERGDEFRQNLPGYYVKNPNKLLLRLYSTARYGFVNLIDTVVARNP